MAPEILLSKKDHNDGIHTKVEEKPALGDATQSNSESLFVSMTPDSGSRHDRENKVFLDERSLEEMEESYERVGVLALTSDSTVGRNG